MYALKLDTYSGQWANKGENRNIFSALNTLWLWNFCSRLTALLVICDLRLLGPLQAVWNDRLEFAIEMFFPQQSGLRLSSPPAGQGADVEARARDRIVPADFRVDSLATVPPTPQRKR
ncbi:hypothetical protein PoB_005879400 [Plakobranchus ocellatus]|uniref:Uncharacterized protein n=1 Tax=Plakobranchus ocellatus TaxID=259542 RepID=A0AAV4CLU5_9GAST|nr:hypothetical protein PoB_005879400 [Plakobranchus ocellatus]